MGNDSCSENRWTIWVPRSSHNNTFLIKKKDWANFKNKLPNYPKIIVRANITFRQHNNGFHVLKFKNLLITNVINHQDWLHRNKQSISFLSFMAKQAMKRARTGSEREVQSEKFLEAIVNTGILPSSYINRDRQWCRGRCNRFPLQLHIINHLYKVPLHWNISFHFISVNCYY